MSTHIHVHLPARRVHRDATQFSKESYLENAKHWKQKAAEYRTKADTFPEGSVAWATYKAEAKKAEERAAKSAQIASSRDKESREAGIARVMLIIENIKKVLAATPKVDKAAVKSIEERLAKYQRELNTLKSQAQDASPEGSGVWAKHLNIPLTEQLRLARKYAANNKPAYPGVSTSWEAEVKRLEKLV
jgi:hypothetical protein